MKLVIESSVGLLLKVRMGFDGRQVELFSQSTASY